MITLNKLLSIKIKNQFFFSYLNEVKKFYKRKLETTTTTKKYIKKLLFLTHLSSLLHFPMFSGGRAM